MKTMEELWMWSLALYVIALVVAVMYTVTIARAIEVLSEQRKKLAAERNKALEEHLEVLRYVEKFGLGALGEQIREIKHLTIKLSEVASQRDKAVKDLEDFKQRIKRWSTPGEKL